MPSEMSGSGSGNITAAVVVAAEQMDKKRDMYDLWPSIVSINKELGEFVSKHKMIKFFNADLIILPRRSRRDDTYALDYES